MILLPLALAWVTPLISRPITSPVVHAGRAALLAAPPVRRSALPAMGADAEWVCEDCGYVFYGEEPPAECPACLASAAEGCWSREGGPAAPASTEAAVPIADAIPPAPTGEVSEWVCEECGYVMEAVDPPANCPACWASADDGIWSRVDAPEPEAAAAASAPKEVEPIA